MSDHPCIVWFRHDLRLADNPALQSAIDDRVPILPVFIWAPDEEDPWAPGSASRWWLHHSLEALAAQLGQLQSRLILRAGPTLETLRRLVKETKARSVVWNRCYEPAVVRRDTQIKKALEGDGVEVASFNGSLLFEPWELLTKQDRPYQVFTPYWNAVRVREQSDPLPKPRSIPSPPHWPHSLDLAELHLLPAIDWAGGMRSAWQPGEVGANQRLEKFLDQSIDAYAEDRDRPDRDGTSSLSPHLHFGEISPKTIWHAVHARTGLKGGVKGLSTGAEVYLKEVVWRDFAHELLFHFPDTTEQPLRGQFADFPWRDDPPALRAWQRGRTGYPLVDAGMRQLWSIGWMHNRVRMVAASFLVKHLLLPWQTGSKWFWDTLVDSDLANNTLGWQWVAGCGADAAPYFRIFNPITQGEKFDPGGDYVRRWIPELARLPDAFIHQPWEASPAVLQNAGVVLGRTYPEPIVEHAAARARALQALASISTPAGS